MRYTTVAALLACLFWCASAEAAGPNRTTSPRRLFPTNAETEWAAGRFLQEDALASDSPSKSSKLAFLLSLAVPGLGEFYAGAKKRGAAFMAVEAFTWISYARWRSKGNDLKAEFRRFADQNWDETRYRQWQEYNRAHGSPYHETETLPCKEEDLDIAGCERVDTQQYYEMIGKYDQFVFGWSDVRDASFEVPNSQVQSGVREGYEDQRNESNKLLKRGSVVLGLAVLSRITSAIHASACTRSLNAEASPGRLSVGFSPMDARGRPAPAVALNARF